MSGLAWTGLVVAGAAGAVCRYLADLVLAPRIGRRFPWSTFVVNVTGSFLLGLVAGATGGLLPDDVGRVLAVGFCGAYTTFSTHMVDTVHLAEDAGAPRAAANVVVSLASGLAAMTLGLALTG